jgi:hypothetical protein
MLPLFCQQKINTSKTFNFIFKKFPAPGFQPFVKLAPLTSNLFLSTLFSFLSTFNGFLFFFVLNARLGIVVKFAVSRDSLAAKTKRNRVESALSSWVILRVSVFGLVLIFGS